MEPNFFDTDFKFEKYITERLIEIEDEGERIKLKELMKKSLIPFYENCEKEYANLSAKLLSPEERKKSSFQLITGIEKRNLVDTTDDTIFPMRLEDVKRIEIDTDEMITALREKNKYRIMTVFVEADLSVINDMINEHSVFKGILHTQDGEYPVSFVLEQNKEYLQQIADLYKIYVRNLVPWSTVCVPYLYKFLDMILMDASLPENMVVCEVEADFREYGKYVKQDIVPMWNIRKFKEQSSTFPNLAVDRMHYEHYIYREKIKEDRDYLINNKDVNIWNALRVNNDLRIICDAEQAIKWELLEFNDEILKRSTDTQYFQSTACDSTKCIHTYAEIRKYVLDMGLSSYLKFIDIKICTDRVPQHLETYSMNAFLEDEIRNGRNRTVLRFTFSAVQPEYYLNRDLMSYVISQLQWMLPEFECIGELI